MTNEIMDKGVPALYGKHADPRSSGNPFLECLPPLADTRRLKEEFTYLPEYPPGYQDTFTDRQRISLLSSIKTLRIPFNSCVDLASEIHQMLFEGYFPRNPMNYEDLAIIRNAEGETVNSRNYMEKVKRRPYMTLADTANFFGISGCGKTTTVETALRMFPQLITHTEYDGRRFTREQITYLFVEIPHDGTIGGLLENTVKSIEEAIGGPTSQTKEIRRMTQAKMVHAIGNLLTLHGVGLLAIDEAQSLIKDSNGRKLQNFITNMMNLWKVPILFIGTPASEKLFDECLHSVRRLGVSLGLTLNRIKKDSPEWKMLIGALFKLQVTKHKTALTEELSSCFYEKTQGILSLVISLFIRVQRYAIKNKTVYPKSVLKKLSLEESPVEVMTERIISKVYEEEFRPVHRAVQRIKKDSLRKNDDIGGAMAFIENTIEYSDRVEEILNPEILRKTAEHENVKKALIKAISEYLAGFENLNLTEREIRAVAEETAGKEICEDMDVSELLDTAYQKAKAVSKAKEKRPKADKTKKPEKGTMRAVLADGATEESNYSRLESAGFVASGSEFFS